MPVLLTLPGINIIVRNVLLPIMQKVDYKLLKLHNSKFNALENNVPRIDITRWVYNRWSVEVAP